MTHFHSSTTSGSASLISLRILPRVSPRQSPSSAILFEMSSDADGPWLASDFFMFSSWAIAGVAWRGMLRLLGITFEHAPPSGGVRGRCFRSRLGSGRFLEGLNRDALVAHLEDLQVAELAGA